MKSLSPQAYALNLPALLRGEMENLVEWSQRWSTRRCAMQIVCVICGAGVYGASMGWWNSAQQGLYAAIKLPLVMLLTAGGNALINGMLAPLLGLNISFRQSFSAILMSFTVTSAILGAFGPLIAFLVWNAPPMPLTGHSSPTYRIITLAHVAIIAFAGTTGNARLLQLLQRLAGNRGTAVRVLLVWLAANLFLGSQLSWILRPFIGSPLLPVEFIRPTALQGNFYEAVFYMIHHMFDLD